MLLPHLCSEVCHVHQPVSDHRSHPPDRSGEPGPDFALILRTSLHRPTALGAALGIAIAILLHATLSLTGISLLIASQPWLFLAVKVVGALYLGWLG